MNIYIPIEVKVREIEGRTLLALAAAERGHTVILGGKEDTLVLARKGYLPPGILHDKSLTPGDKKIDYLIKLLKNGHLVTSQDEESGLMDESYKYFASIRFSDVTISKASRIFAWGEHDFEALKDVSHSYSDRISCTGSPRVDFWREDFAKYYQHNGFNLRGTENVRPLILVASNFGSSLNENRIWNRIARSREAGYYERDPERESYEYENEAYQLRLIREFIFMIRELVTEYPDIDVLLRPHPVESVDAWVKLMGDYPRVTIHRNGTISGWIRSASLLIHNGCTSALEAAACGIPRIAYRPLPSELEREIPNQLSYHAFTMAELKNYINDILANRLPSDYKKVEQLRKEIVDTRFSNLTGKLAADRMVDEWEIIGESIQSEQISPEALLRLKPKKSGPIKQILKKSYLQVRNAIKPPSDTKKPKQKYLKTGHKFPGFEESELKSLIESLRFSLDRFHDVDFTRFGERSFVLYSRKKST